MLLIFSGLLLWLSEVFCLGRRLGGERSQAIQREVQSGKISGKTLVSQMQVWLGQTTVTGCVPALSLSLSLYLSLSPQFPASCSCKVVSYLSHLKMELRRLEAEIGAQHNWWMFAACFCCIAVAV